MKIIMKAFAILVLMMAVFSPQVPASANGLETKYHGAEASFQSREGCILTSVIIEVGEDTIYSIGLHQQDTCTGQFLLEAYGRKLLTKKELKYSGNLDLAQLTTTVNVVDWDRQLFFDVFIDLTWIGKGELRIYNSHYKYWLTPDCPTNILIKEKYRDAQASGTVSDGTVNYTPVPDSSARLLSAMRVEGSSKCE